MRVCRSYLSLMARSTLYKELALFVVMAVVELALFIPNLEKQFSEVVGIGENGEEIYSMYSLPVDEIAENTHLQWVWIAALVLLSLILIRTAGRWRDYTLDRLESAAGKETCFMACTVRCPSCCCGPSRLRWFWSCVCCTDRTCRQRR